jgi:hypothetical protein
MYRSFVALKVLNATKTSFAQHLTGIKHHLYLLHNFLFTIQRHYGKAPKRI